MKKKDIVRKSSDFETIINSKNCVRNKYFSIFWLPSNETKFGISVPKKTGTAVVRNKIKRQVKNIIDNNKKDIQNGLQYVIIIRRSVLELDYKMLEDNLICLIKKI